MFGDVEISGNLSSNVILVNLFFGDKHLLTLSLIQKLSDASAAESFLKTLTKEEIAQNYRDFLFFDKNVQSRLLQNCRMREQVKTFLDASAMR